MKKIDILVLLGLLLICGALLGAPIPGRADEEVTTEKTIIKRTTSANTGIVSEIGSNGIVVRTSPASTPVACQFTRATSYVDEAGQPIAMNVVKAGLPVTVYYTKSGDELVATKVVVNAAPSSFED